MRYKEKMYDIQKKIEIQKQTYKKQKKTYEIQKNEIQKTYEVKKKR